MRATTRLTFPTGVKMGEGVTPFFGQAADHAELSRGQANVQITKVTAIGRETVEVEIELDVALVATFLGDRGRGNPSLRISIDKPPD